MKHSIAILMASALFISGGAFAYQNLDIPELFPLASMHGTPVMEYKDDAGVTLFGPEMYGSVVADVMLGRDNPGNDDGFPADNYEYIGG